MENKYKTLLCALYLSLGPIVWFSSFTLGPIKRILLILIIIAFLPYFIGRNVKGLSTFFLIAICFLATLWMNWGHHSEDVTNVILGIIEDFIFFVIGYILAKKRVLENNNSFNIVILLIPLIASFFTISNFIIGLPSWTAPGQLEKFAEKASFGYEIEKLWQTGFSWGRNGWGCTLCLLLPFCLLLKSKIQAFSFWIIIFFSILICGNRNGMLAGLICLFAFLFLSKMIKRKYSIGLVIGIFALFALLIIVSGTTDILTLLRLNESDDISSGRLVQYLMIPDMISEMGFWGLGHGGTAQYLFNHGLGEHSLHTTYFKILIEYGWLVGFCLLCIVIHSFRLSIHSLKSKDLYELAMSLVLISGLVIALFEPEVVFGTLGGYAIWWFSYGYLLSKKEQSKKEMKYGYETRVS